jgi:peptidoglycan/LPS O-acetylase OafA/YrhL
MKQGIPVRQRHLGSAEFRIRGLDGLRAVAMTLVFFEHKTDIGHKLHLGIGVWLFFVLSGYLITSIVLERRRVIETRHSSAKKELLSFFYRRAFRIFPAYYALLIIASFLSSETHPFVTAGWALVYATYTTNLAIELVTKSWPSLGHLWTLAVEEQFYIIVAPLFLLIPIRKAKYVAGGLLTAAISALIALLAAQASMIVLGTDSLVNFGIMAVGVTLAIMAIAPANGKASLGVVLGLVGMVATTNITTLTHVTFNPAAGALLFWAAIIFAALTIWSIVANQDSGAVAFLHWKPIQLLGRISYAFYLWHYLVDFRFAEPALHALLPGADDDSMSLLICLADYTATAAVAAASWVLIERPLLKMRDRLFQQKVPARSKT